MSYVKDIGGQGFTGIIVLGPMDLIIPRLEILKLHWHKSKFNIYGPMDAQYAE